MKQKVRFSKLIPLRSTPWSLGGMQIFEQLSCDIHIEGRLSLPADSSGISLSKVMYQKCFIAIFLMNQTLDQPHAVKTQPRISISRSGTHFKLRCSDRSRRSIKQTMTCVCHFILTDESLGYTCVEGLGISCFQSKLWFGSSPSRLFLEMPL